jgi:hypothetical protein
LYERRCKARKLSYSGQESAANEEGDNTDTESHTRHEEEASKFNGDTGGSGAQATSKNIDAEDAEGTVQDNEGVKAPDPEAKPTQEEVKKAEQAKKNAYVRCWRKKRKEEEAEEAAKKGSSMLSGPSPSRENT